MATTQTTQPPQAVPPRPPYTDHLVWDDDSGDHAYIEGHVLPPRRAIAVANHWARGCGMVNLLDDKAATADSVAVSYAYLRPDPQAPGDDESAAWCTSTHPDAQPVTVLSW